MAVSKIARPSPVKVLKVDNTIVTFTNGVATYDISSLSLSETPMFLVIGNTTSRDMYLLNTDIGGSTSQSLKFRASMAGSVFSGYMRVIIVIFA